MNYSVGQVIYALLENKKVIIPIRIVEEITVKNLEEERTTYKAIIPNNKKEKVSLDKFDIVFESIDDTTSYLFENARNAIDELALKAIDLEEKFFVKDSVDNIACKNENSQIKIDLGDGQKANINIENLKHLNLKEEVNGSNTKESTTA